MHIETLAVHAGTTTDPKTGAVTPPIHLSTTFERAPDGSFPGGFIYTRSGNPTRQALEACLMELEGGAAAAAFSSGQAATFAILQSLSPGDHVIAPEDAYYGTADLLLEHFGHWGLEATLVDMTDPSAVAAAVRPATRLLWVETPSNPRIRVTDIAAIVDIAQRASARVACDNTWATPMLQHPLQLGADIVMHATTKYPGRAQRHPGRRGRHADRRRVFRPHPHGADGRGRRAVALRVLARDARDPHAAVSHARALGQRPRPRALSRRAPPHRACLLPRARNR